MRLKTTPMGSNKCNVKDTHNYYYTMILRTHKLYRHESVFFSLELFEAFL